MKHKLLFFLLSGLVIIPGLFFLITGGLRLGIDFTGGTQIEYRFNQTVNSADLNQYGEVIPEGNNTYKLRSKSLTDQEKQTIKTKLNQKYPGMEVLSDYDISPTISSELKTNALKGLLFACVMIVIYISWSFRKVPKPASSLRFGVAAIVALIHDVLVVAGVFAILGEFLGVEIDTLFVTALLTVIGFSVHDTIVVFDRIRENLPKHLGRRFSDVADISITQTLGRSLNTSLTVILVLLALLLFGGETIRYFVVALLVGVISGTYSSIFNATALLCFWEEKLKH